MNSTTDTMKGNSKFIIKELHHEDEKELHFFNEKCIDYFMSIEGRQSLEGLEQELLNELPPNKKLSDKFVLGVYKGDNNLIAVIDIVKDYKLENEWTIGLLLIDPSERDKGLGTSLHNYLVELVSVYQANKFRIGVVVENLRGLNFWTKLGYHEVDRVTIKVANRDREVIVMNYLIT